MVCPRAFGADPAHGFLLSTRTSTIRLPRNFGATLRTTVSTSGSSGMKGFRLSQCW
jgi:hypothetical protein